MKEFKQQIINFDYEKNLNNDDFFVSKSNEHVINFLNLWPKWERKFLNIIGEKFSGKSHIINIFIKKNNGLKLEANSLNNDSLKEIKIHQNIILENLSENINEKLAYSLLNIIEQDNKYLIVSSNRPIVNFNFKLDDLKSRAKNFILQSIEKPDDELILALIVKNLSDRQITLDNKLINYIIKRIDRSYRKIFEFIYKIDEISLKKKKSINFKIIKEVLEDF